MSNKHEAYFKSHDNHRLYYEVHQPAKPLASLIIVHGLGEHIGRYQNVINYLKEQYNIYLYDQRGHGRSDGVRFHIQDFSHYVNDLHEFVNLVTKKHPKQKTYLLGHSMGGQVVLNYLGQHPRTNLKGFITSSPNIKVKMKINPIKRKLVNYFAGYLPKFKLPNQIPTKWICRDKEVVKAYKHDPLVGKWITMQLASELIANQEHLLNEANKIKIPALMLHAGDDLICDKQGSIDFFDQLSSRDKDLKIYKGMYHEIFNEIDKEQVLAELASWIKKRSLNS
ncbi:hypothetical protein BVY03_03045 [bacterium K02(2017)]|nr:hypothetical protein BVY03_03045 [bacterium K02(2017)]